MQISINSQNGSAVQFCILIGSLECKSEEKKLLSMTPQFKVATHDQHVDGSFGVCPYLLSSLCGVFKLSMMGREAQGIAGRLIPSWLGRQDGAGTVLLLSGGRPWSFKVVARGRLSGRVFVICSCVVMRAVHCVWWLWGLRNGVVAVALVA